MTGVGDWHVNADEPSILDYNTEFKTAGQVTSLYAPDEFRISDHDPVVVGLDLADDAAGFVTGGGIIQSPAGALAADPYAGRQGRLQLDLDYTAGATHPSGEFGFSLGGKGTPFALTSTSFDFLVIRGDASRFAGTAHGQRRHGYTYTRRRHSTRQGRHAPPRRASGRRLARLRLRRAAGAGAGRDPQLTC